MATKARKYRFSFGPWNIHEGADPFGPTVRQPIAFSHKLKDYKKLGFAGVQFHDDDAVPHLNKMSHQAIMKQAAALRKVLRDNGLAPEFVAPRLWEDRRAVNDPKESIRIVLEGTGFLNNLDLTIVIDSPNIFLPSEPRQKTKPLNNLDNNRKSLRSLSQPSIEDSFADQQKILIVHGRNHTIRDKIVSFLTSDLGLLVQIMETHAHNGRTLAEKLEYTIKECRYAICLLTADDDLIDKQSNKPLKRPRPNVMLELGLLWGLLGRERVVLVIQNDSQMELPSDISGIGYVPITPDLGQTKLQLLKELKKVGIV